MKTKFWGILTILAVLAALCTYTMPAMAGEDKLFGNYGTRVDVAKTEGCDAPLSQVTVSGRVGKGLNIIGGSFSRAMDDSHYTSFEVTATRLIYAKRQMSLALVYGYLGETAADGYTNELVEASLQFGLDKFFTDLRWYAAVDGNDRGFANPYVGYEVIKWREFVFVANIEGVNRFDNEFSLVKVGPTMRYPIGGATGYARYYFVSDVTGHNDPNHEVRVGIDWSF